ncbi:UNVERIFIED_CONTAM: hypothetical protein GTU68_000654 [Idotea baltica]|nr:hypothetical protein [Idotea baltica]
MRDRIGPGELFEDEVFPASDQSLYFEDRRSSEGIRWMRPQELVSSPELFVGGVNRRDVIQGELGDCWFLSSCAAVAKMLRRIEKLIPPNQPLSGNDYKGLIVCHFWRFGEWVTVCIDDLLPTKNGKLIYARSEAPNEFWISLLEKAYAKLHGSYQALGGGQSMDAMVDLTGGIAERYDLSESPEKNKVYKHIAKASRNGAFITSSRKGDWKKALTVDKNGLVEGHAYSVSRVSRVIHSKKGKIPLILIRNPWGNDAEWNGRWSDGDEMWDHVSADMRRKLLTNNQKDGEFWMCFDDFYKEYEEISMCSIGPDFDNDGIVDKAGMVGQYLRCIN